MVASRSHQHAGHPRVLLVQGLVGGEHRRQGSGRPHSRKLTHELGPKFPESRARQAAQGGKVGSGGDGPRVGEAGIWRKKNVLQR